jgi:dTDP-4-amino-4,6-dideoxygalactose transaminase
VQYAVAVSSATAGLHLALLALELPKGSTVVTSPISFLSSSNAALYCGYKPEFIDIDPRDLNISTVSLLNFLSQSSTARAIVPVHFGGLPCDMKEIQKISKQYHIRTVEDAAHAFGASYECGSPVGSCKYSDMTVFSFHPVKSVTTGEGGIITTNNPELYRKLLRLRTHGISQFDDLILQSALAFTGDIKNPWYYEMQELGFHYRLTEIQAVLGLSQIKKAHTFMKKRLALAIRYDEKISTIPGIKPGQAISRKNSANHIYVIRIDFTRLRISRAELIIKLRLAGIGTQVHYIPIPLQPYYVNLGYTTKQIPEAMQYYNDCLTIPLFPKLSKRKQNYILAKFKDIIADNLIT